MPSTPNDLQADRQHLEDAFLAGFRALFLEARSLLREQGDDASWAHEQALGLLTDRLFAHFVRCGAPNLTGAVPAVGWPDARREAALPDRLLAEIERFFAGFPFALQEAGPRDAEAVIDPGMIATLHESLSGMGAEDDGGDPRSRAGIFYTARAEIDLMCRLALADVLANHLGQAYRDVTRSFVFAATDEGRQAADAAIAAAGLWQPLHALLREVTACDPACGCGSFLVGMLAVLEEMQARADQALGLEQSRYERRRRIITHSLYGMDVMAWAVRATEMRLRLQLVAVAAAERSAPWNDLLPDLTGRIRHGDALVPEGCPGARDAPGGWGEGIPPSRLGVPDTARREPRPPEDSCAAEGAARREPRPPEDSCAAEGAARREPRLPEGSGERYDIVIGNPPYVRHEEIEDPLGRFGKAEYKQRLGMAAAAAQPGFFGYRPATGKARRRLNGQSDLYAYFYVLGLSLLKPRGAFCFLTSNSWLDADFGAGLQELLLTRSHLKLVIDHRARRSFRDAAVNTVIVLLAPASPGELSRAELAERRARFVVLNLPWEQAAEAGVWARIEGAAGRQVRPEFRVIARSQQELYDEGLLPGRGLLDLPRYGGNALGGSYLRAPDLFHEMLDGCGERLCRLDALAETRFGIKTGANRFFYFQEVAAPAQGEPALPASGEIGWYRNGAGHVFPLECHWVRPVLTTPRVLTAPEVAAEGADAFLFACPEAREALAGTLALQYIEWGERETDAARRPTTRQRGEWYQVPLVEPPPVIHPFIAYERACAGLNPAGLFCDANLAGIYPRRPEFAEALAACLASSLGVLTRELAGLANLGQGALKTNPAYLARMRVPDLRRMGADERARLARVFGAVRRKPFPTLLQGEPDADWRELDAAVLALLGPGAPDPARLRAVAREMVAARLAKVGSV